MDNLYDEVVEVKNSREIESPPDLDVSSAIQFIQSDMQKISNGEEGSEDFPMPGRKSGEKRPPSSLKKKYPSLTKSESFGSDSDSSKTGSEENKTYGDGEFNPKQYENLNVPADVKDMFQYIVRYTPQKIDIDYKLRPFIPDFIPAVGDIDAFLKVVPPSKTINEKSEIFTFIKTLGLEILDEPSGTQSEPALLHMKLRSISIAPRAPKPQPAVVKSSKDIDRWITEIQSLHANQPQPTVMYNAKMPDIDSLMSEWPLGMEKVLDTIGFPSASLDCSLTYYIELICALLDIPIAPTKTQADYIFALHTLFNLYGAVRAST